MEKRKSGRFTIVNEEDEQEKPLKTGGRRNFRITGIEPEKNLRNRQRLATIGLIAVVGLLTAGVVFFVAKNHKPDILSFLSSNDPAKKSAPEDIFSRDNVVAPESASKNEHLRLGISSYERGYLNDAMAEFSQVVESDALDADKAVALTYMGIIEDSRGNYQKALEFYSRAAKYNEKDPAVFRNLAVTYKNMKKYTEALQYAQKAVELDPAFAANHLLVGNILYYMTRYSDAIDSYKKVLELDEKNASALYNIAQCYIQQGKDAQAIEYLRSAAEANPEGNIAYMAYSRLGLVALSTKDYATAEINFNRAIALHASDPTDFYNLGIAYLEQGKKEDALRAFTKSESLAAEDANMLESIGSAYTTLGNYDQAISVYEKLMKINSRNVKVLSLLGDLFYQKGELEQAIKFYRKIIEIEPSSEHARSAFINLGIALDDAGRSDDAIEAYQSALAINPKDDVALYNLGIAFKHAGKPEKALEAWKKATDLNPDNEKPLLARADLLYERAEYDEALEAYGVISEKFPLLSRPHFSIASIYFKRSEFAYAKKRYLKVIELNNDKDLTLKSLVNLALISSQDKTDTASYNEAVSYIQKALALNDSDPEALKTLGIVYSRRGSYELAIEALYQAVKSSNDKTLTGQIYNQIGICYYRTGDFKKALRAFTQGSDEDPSNEEIRVNKKSAMQAYEKTLEN